MLDILAAENQVGLLTLTHPSLKNTQNSISTKNKSKRESTLSRRTALGTPSAAFLK